MKSDFNQPRLYFFLGSDAAGNFRLASIPSGLSAFFVVVLSVISLAFLSSPLWAGSGSVVVDHGARDPAMSPDGTWIAASVLGRICLLPSAGGTGQVLSSGIGWDRFPAWSPDGAFLAFSHELNYRSYLVVYDVPAGTSAILYETDGVIGQIAYDPAGGYIFFTVRHGQGDAHIWEISSRGGKPEEITETRGWHEWSFAPSPSGKRLLLSSGLYGGANLYMLDMDKRQAIRLTNTRFDDTSVAWSRDGARVAYVETGNGADEIRVDQAEGGGKPRVVLRNAYQDEQITFGRDANTLIVCAARKLYRLDIASGALAAIPFRISLLVPPQSPSNLLLIHARLIDGTGRPPIPDASILIRDGRITKIQRGSFRPSDVTGVPVFDVQGDSVLPGLMDNHYHFWDAFDGSRLLSRGITCIRDPGADLADSLNFKEAIALGLEPGPDIYTAGPLIDGFGTYHPMVAVQIDQPEQAKSLVDSLKAQGVDLLKVYFLLKPEVLKAVIEAAHQDHLRVTGHIGVRTSWTEAIGDGIDGLNHIRVWPEFLPTSAQPQGADRTLDAAWHLVARMQANWRTIDPDSVRAQELIGRMLQAKIGFDPTLSIQAPAPSLRKQLSLEEFATWEQSYERMSQFVRNAAVAGVPLLAGTDDGNLFDELEAYEQAGIPRQQIIQAATGNGASWLGKGDDFGTAQAGLRADLIVVHGDPLASIKSLRNIIIVVKNGRVVFHK
ncbi:MAG TPA: amidohydrolase family protein [Candidatus Acidoferrales bacterium]|nr:amidohydrolase family protein [Candidatus Acidoferrales bacterium]